jgi:hypothetical protein
MDRNDPRKIQRKVVGALQKLLMETELEDLLSFLHELHLQYTVTVSPKGNFVCRLFKNKRIDGEDTQVFSYDGGSNQSVRAAVCDAIADFLIRERNTDYHEWVFEDWPELEIQIRASKSLGERIIEEKKHPKKSKFKYVSGAAVTHLAEPLSDALATLDEESK